MYPILTKYNDVSTVRNRKVLCAFLRCLMECVIITHAHKRFATAPNSPPAQTLPCMQAGEEPCAYLKRAFFEVLGSLGPTSLDRVPIHFHRDFQQYADGEILDLQAFTTLLSAQKARLAQAPRFSWKQLVATTSPDNGRHHITSIHDVVARLKSGHVIRQHVMALVQVDAHTGTIIQCDELTRMEGPCAPERYQPFTCTAGAFEGGGAPQQPETQRAAQGAPDMDEAQARKTSPGAKRARSSPELVVNSENPMRLYGVPLRRTTPTDHLEPPTVCLLRASSLGQLASAFDSFASLGARVAPTAKRGVAIDAKTGRSLSHASTTLAYDESDCDSIFDSASCHASVDMS